MTDNKINITASIAASTMLNRCFGEIRAVNITVPFKSRLIHFLRFMVYAIWMLLAIPFMFITWANLFGISFVFVSQVLPFYGFLSGIILYFKWDEIPYEGLRYD